MADPATSAAAEEEPVMELEHAVGYSGDVPHTLCYHPTEPNKYFYAAGSCIGERLSPVGRGSITTGSPCGPPHPRVPAVASSRRCCADG